MGRPGKGKRRVADDGSFTVSGKASNGEGSLYRESDGSWRATYPESTREMHHTPRMARRQLLRVQKERDLMGYTITRYLTCGG